MIKTWNSHKKLKLVSFIASTLLLAGCLPELEDDTPPLVEFSPEQIDAALSPELNKVFLNNIKVGNMVEYQSTYRVEINPNHQEVFYKKRTVKKTSWETNPAYMVMDYKYENYLDKDFVERDEIWEFENPLAVQSLQSFFPFADDEPVLSLKYYNLTTRRKNVRPPEVVMNRPNCGGLDDCNIQGIELNYLVHVLKNGKVIQKQQRQEFVSAEIPALYIIDTVDPYGAYYPMAYRCDRFVSEGTFVKLCVTLTDLDKNQ